MMNRNWHKEVNGLVRKCPNCSKEICLPPNGDTHPYAKCPYCGALILV